MVSVYSPMFPVGYRLLQVEFKLPCLYLQFFLLFLFYALMGALSCFLLLLGSMIQFLQGKLMGPR